MIKYHAIEFELNGTVFNYLHLSDIDSNDICKTHTTVAMRKYGKSTNYKKVFHSAIKMNDKDINHIIKKYSDICIQGILNLSYLDVHFSRHSFGIWAVIFLGMQ